jgi:hypothetical protein
MNDNRKTQEGLTDETGIQPKIYSKRAIWGFSFFFSTIFGAVLLMQNLRGIGKKKESYIVLFLSILYTTLTIYIVNIPEEPKTSLTYLCNIVGGVILTEYVYTKYFSDDQNIEKKKIWKPLIISILITIPFVLALIYSK